MNVGPFVPTFDRIPPNNTEAEMALLGSILVEPSLLTAVARVVQPSDFYATMHETAYLAILALAERGDPIDKVSLAEELRERGMLDKIGGMAQLNACMDAVPTAASAMYYAKLVRDKATHRAMIVAGKRLTEIGYDSEGDLPGGLAQADTVLRDVTDRNAAAEGWTGRTAEEIARDGVPPIAWAIQDLLPVEDGPCFLVGPPASFKTWTALEAIRCLVTGDPFAGRYHVPNPRPHGLVVNFDAGSSAIQRRVQMTGCKAANITVFSPTAWDRREFERLLAQHPGAAVLIDCWADVYHPDPAQEIGEATRAFVRDLRHLFAKYGCVGFIIDHSKRGNGAKSAPEYYGSVQKLGSSRVMWTVEPVTDEGDPNGDTSARPMAKVVCTKMSEAETFDPLTLAFDFSESRVEVSVTGGLTRVETSRDRMLAMIDAEGPVTRDQLGATYGGRSKKDFDALIFEERGGPKPPVMVYPGRKIGRKLLYWTRERIEEEIRTGYALNPIPDETREERDNHAGLNRVRDENPIQPDTSEPPSAPALRVSESGATGVRVNEPGTGFLPKENPVRVPGSRPADLTALPVARDGFTYDTLPCAIGDHGGRLHPSDAVCKACDPKGETAASTATQ